MPTSNEAIETTVTLTYLSVSCLDLIINYTQNMLSNQLRDKNPYAGDNILSTPKQKSQFASISFFHTYSYVNQIKKDKTEKQKHTKESLDRYVAGELSALIHLNVYNYI